MSNVRLMRPFLLLLVLAIPISTAWGRECTSEEGDLAITKGAYAKDWKTLYSAFQLYGHCDDGAVAEGFSDVNIELLLKDWAGFFAPGAAWKNNQKFRNFVIRHIDGMASPEELKQVMGHAKNNCPSNESKFCKHVAHEALITINEGNK